MFLRSLLLSLLLVFSMANALAKSKKQKGLYAIDLNRNVLQPDLQQSYLVYFITPKNREEGLESFNSDVAEKRQKQMKKYFKKQEKLKEELVEKKYHYLEHPKWDNSVKDLLVLVVPVIRDVNYQAAGVYVSTSFKNHHEIQTASIVDKRFGTLCKPKHEETVEPSDYYYISKVYVQKSLGLLTSVSQFDYSNNAKVFTFDPKCVMEDGSMVLIDHKHVEASKTKISKNLKKMVSEDMGLN